MTSRTLRAVLALPLLLASLTAGAEDRAPTAAERDRIEQVLRGHGFSSWGEIGLDGGIWSVDDAHDAQGRERDIRLTPGEYRLVADDEEDRQATDEEFRRIEAALKRGGFVEITGARLEDGLWEVQDAQGPDKRSYFLVLDRETLRILHRAPRS
ncbi:hypothetical protein ACFOD4_17590 [Pseudoroseomonas globiformis]|uniref:PepSY domain-containing protein n=1 Tax=Teichococcus globiformis TaxID=2307229 RepID=A0ABV7G9I6_9PROT